MSSASSAVNETEAAAFEGRLDCCAPCADMVLTHSEMVMKAARRDGAWRIRMAKLDDWGTAVMDCRTSNVDSCARHRQIRGYDHPPAATPGFHRGPSRTVWHADASARSRTVCVLPV